MKKVLRNLFLCIIMILFFLYLLLCPETALISAREGLLLWYSSVLPVLFPFMLLCGISLRLGIFDSILPTLMRPLRLLFGCSGYGAFAIVTGFLCGFPMGAKVTSDLYRQNKISRSEAHFLYGFVNNVSPAFLVSFVAAGQMHRSSMGGLLLINVLGSALIYGILTSFRYRRSHTAAADAAESSARTQDSINLFQIIDECIYDTIQSTLQVGAYIVLFSILNGAFSLFADLADPVILFLSSCIEITNGMAMICTSPLSFPQKYVMASSLSAFGGLSALAQTAGITSMDKHTFFYYIKSRVACTLLASLLALCSVIFC